jgi:hypothetical protein
MNTYLDVLAITPTTAVVKVDREGECTGTPYTDFHTLIKLDDTWTIIAKVFHAYDVLISYNSRYIARSNRPSSRSVRKAVCFCLMAMAHTLRTVRIFPCFQAKSHELIR